MIIKGSQEHKLGLAGEAAVRRDLKAAGLLVLPASMIERGGAPLIEFIGGGIIAPDILAWYPDGTPLWVDVKTKESPVKRQLTGFWREGCDLPNWNHYLEAQERTRIKGAIAIIEIRPQPSAPADPRWYFATLDHLAPNVQIDPRGHDKAPWGMAYWNIDDMVPMGPASIDLCGIQAIRRKVYAWAEGTRSLTERQPSFDW
jgi:hypothetical protein